MRVRDRPAWLGIVGAYIIVFGGMLLATGGLPYAIDNNESFSSLWHARNLHNISWGLTKGLTDEVASRDPAASPFIHTHQGNFPRFFSYFLYLLGARSVEAQIALTTFTVGLLAIWFAYRLLRTIGPPSCAALACLALITDYAL